VIAASRFQISNLKFEIRNENAKERKVRTPKGGEPANGGAFDEIPNSRFQIGTGMDSLDDDKCNRKQTSLCRSDFEISNLNTQVMGETVRPARANFKFEISDLK